MCPALGVGKYVLTSRSPRCFADRGTQYGSGGGGKCLRCVSEEIRLDGRDPVIWHPRRAQDRWSQAPLNSLRGVLGGDLRSGSLMA